MLECVNPKTIDELEYFLASMADTVYETALPGWQTMLKMYHNNPADKQLYLQLRELLFHLQNLEILFEIFKYQPSRIQALQSLVFFLQNKEIYFLPGDIDPLKSPEREYAFFRKLYPDLFGET